MARTDDSGRRAVLARLPGVAAAGLAGWVVDTATLWLLSQRFGVATWLAAATGFVLSGVVNFTINRRVFEAGYSHRRVLRYLVLFAGNLAVVTVAVPLLATGLGGLFARPGLALLTAKVIVTAALLPVNTTVYGRWVFRGPAGTATPGDSP